MTRFNLLALCVLTIAVGILASCEEKKRTSPIVSISPLIHDGAVLAMSSVFEAYRTIFSGHLHFHASCLISALRCGSIGSADRFLREIVASNKKL